MAEKNYVFLVSGWGLGHATRTWAVIQKILEEDKKSKIIIFTWGLGTTFFASKNSQFNFELHSLSSYFEINDLADFRVSKKVRFVFRSLRVWLENSIYIHQILKYKKNLICFVDSDYHFPSYYFKKVFLVSISQTPFIVYHWKQNFLKFSITMNVRFAFFEWFDYRLQRLFSDMIFSPSFHQLAEYDCKIKFIPPIVRKEFLGSLAEVKIDKLGVIGSGSVFSEEIKQKTRNLNYVYEEKNEFGLSADGKPLIDTFGTLVTQCGFSSLSECFARKKQMYLVPIENHPEQMINAYVLVGMNEGTLFGEVKAPKDLFRQTLKVARWDQCNGAEVLIQSLKTSLSKF